MRSLENFVRQAGGRAKAAIAIGVAETTLWRWMEGRAKPRGLARGRLKALGIQWERSDGLNHIARVVQVRPVAEAFGKNDEEMLMGMLSMSPDARVADPDALRVRLWSLGHGAGRSQAIEKVARIARRLDAQD